MNPRVRRTAAATAAVICVAATVACAQPAPAESPSPVPAGLERYYSQQLAWVPCISFVTRADQHDRFADPALDCARLEVPLDYAAPTGRTAQIALLRHRTKEHKIGSLLVNPGGPGGSGVELAAGLGGPLGTGPFDIVGFDPRGIGRSTPTIKCLSGPEMDAVRADTDFDTSPAGVALAEAKSRHYAQLCAERSGGADVLAHFGTRDVARDMDVLRAALGDPKLTYLGFSYGTRLGAFYAEQFPTNVRAMVLDGAIDPRQGLLDSAPAQMAGFQQAFQAYGRDCALKPSCPLGTDPAGATQAFQALTRPLIDRPATVPGKDRTLSYSDAITGTIAELYNPAGWPVLTTGLTQLRVGDGSTLLGEADGYYERSADGSYGSLMDGVLVVNCLDGQRIADHAAAAELSRRANELAPFHDAGRGVSEALDPCAFLPVIPTNQPHRPVVTGMPATLVISTTGDPATPYQAGVALADELHGRLLTVEGTQHTAATQGWPCIDDKVADYLIDLRLPGEGARCALHTP